MSAQDHKNAGNTAFAAGDYAKAVDEFTKAIALQEDHVFYSNRSGAYASMGKWAEALADAEACVRINGSWPKGFSRMGTALFNLGRLDDAKAAYDRGLALDPENAALKEGLREVQAQKQTGAMMTRLMMNPKTRAMMADPAFAAKMKAIVTNPANMMQHLNDPRVQAALGVMMGLPEDGAGAPFGGMGDMGDMGDVGGASVGSDDEDEKEAAAARVPPAPERKGPAVSPYAPPPEPEAATKPVEEEAPVDEELLAEQRAAAARRAEADVEKEKGTAAYLKKDFATATAHYEKACAIDPSNAVYVNNLAAVQFEQGDMEGCLAQCARALQVCEAHKTPAAVKAKTYLRQGNALSKLARWGEALEAYKRSILEDNTQAARDGRRKAEQAKKKAEEEAYLSPQLSEAAKDKGNEEFRAGRFPEAIELYSEALKRDPSNYKVYSNRAACFAKLMQWGRALQDCEACLAADPKFTKAYLRKGKVHNVLKQYPQALSAFKRGLELEPPDSDLAAELREGLEGTRRAIAIANRGEVDEQRIAESMKDPEIQAIMRDPFINQLLQDLKSDPEKAKRVMNDPDVMDRIEKLIAAGIIRG